MTDPINWKPENLPPGAMPWARQVEDAIDASNRTAARADENGSNTDASVASTMSSLSQQIIALQNANASLASQQAQIQAFAQVYFAESTSSNVSVPAQTFGTVAQGLQVSVTVPILTGSVRITMSGRVTLGGITFTCPQAGITQSNTPISHTIENYDPSYAINVSRQYTLTGIPIGNAVFTTQCFASGSGSQTGLFSYPSIAVQNIGA